MSSEERCENCKYWEHTDPDEFNALEKIKFLSDEPDDLVYIGYCRRLPPQIVAPLVTEYLCNMAERHKCRLPGSSVGAIESASVWPVTWYAHWCGEWKPRIPLPVLQ